MSKIIPIMWAARIWIVFVFVQSLFFKFTLSAETQHIFGTLGDWMGLAFFTHYGPYIVGIAELIASIILLSRFWAWGAFLAFEIMCGAVIFHLFTPLGIAMPVFENGIKVGGQDDGGQLFIMACLTLGSAAFLVIRDITSANSQLRLGLSKLSARQ